jgi:hypothetical protein
MDNATSSEHPRLFLRVPVCIATVNKELREPKGRGRPDSACLHWTGPEAIHTFTVAIITRIVLSDSH